MSWSRDLRHATLAVVTTRTSLGETQAETRSLHPDLELCALTASCSTVSAELMRLKTALQEQQKRDKTRFNLFTVLRRDSDEAGLHTRWLAHLLDPTANHDCGNLFLKLFVATLKKHGIDAHAKAHASYSFDEFDTFNYGHVQVRTEVIFLDGRIDLKIESKPWGIILIENKIHAAEQPGQLKRYANYLKAECERENRKSLLLFLTPTGHQSASADAGYYRISYQRHIRGWIQECARATEEWPNINHALKQYYRLICGLTRMPTSDDYMQQVIALLKKHPSIIEHIGDLSAALTALRTNFWRAFNFELRRQLIHRDFLLDDANGPDDRVLIFSKYRLPMTEQHQLGFVIEWPTGEWQRGNTTLLIAASLHHLIDPKRITQVGQQIISAPSGPCASLISQWQDKFQNDYENNPHTWFPLGYLHLSTRDFMSDAFLARSMNNFDSGLVDLVKPIVAKVETFIKLAEPFLSPASIAGHYR